MGLMQRVGTYLERAFATGPALIDPGVAAFGIDNTTYQPAAYVNYPAISNAVYSCVTVRARAGSSLPIKLYTVRADGEREEVMRSPALALLTKVNPNWTMKRLIGMTFSSLDIWGECFWFIERKGRLPAEIWWARADQVTVHPDAENYVRGFTYEVNGQKIFFPREDTVWLRYENLADEFRGLSPLAAARLSADTASAAMKSNYSIFRNGMNIAGVVSPTSKDVPLTNEQLDALQQQFDKRFKGPEAAHKIALLKFGVDIKQLSLTPADAEFLGMMNWSLEDIARAYRVPIDKIGGKRTYQNVEDSEKVFWTDSIKPDAELIAAELTEQLLPQFGGNLIAEFDYSGIDVLHEAETAKWERESGQLDRGAITINQWRESRGMDAVDWGDVAWLDTARMPIDSPEKPQAAMPLAVPHATDDTERSHHPATARIFSYGSAEHEAHWQRQMDREASWERQVGDATAEQMRSQRQSALARLRQRGARAMEDAALEPFDRARYTKAFRVALRPVVQSVVGESGSLTLGDLAIDIAFDVQDPNVLRSIERQTQRFAEEVTTTTWEALKETIGQGVRKGEDIDQIADRVESVMADRIRSSGETIARTEVTAASNQGTQASWKQSGVVAQKTWVSALDARTRSSHVAAHGQTVGIDDDFQVGSGRGPSPGQIGSASQDVNCRCSMIPVLQEST